LSELLNVLCLALNISGQAALAATLLLLLYRWGALRLLLSSYRFWFFSVGCILAGFAVVATMTIRFKRYGHIGWELRFSRGQLRYGRRGIIHAIRRSTYRPDEISDLRVRVLSQRKGVIRAQVCVRLRWRFPIRLRIKTQDAALPGRIESACRGALGLSG